MNKAKILSAVIAAAIMVGITGCKASPNVSNQTISAELTQSSETSAALEDFVSGHDNITLDELNKNFTAGGKNVTLPLTLSDLKDVYSYDMKTIKGTGTDSTIPLYIGDYIVGDVYFYGVSEDNADENTLISTLSLRKTGVNANEELSDVSQDVIINGISFGSSFEDVVSKFGTDYEDYSDMFSSYAGMISYEIKSFEYSSCKINFTFSSADFPGSNVIGITVILQNS